MKQNFSNAQQKKIQLSPISPGKTQKNHNYSKEKYKNPQFLQGKNKSQLAKGKIQKSPISPRENTKITITITQKIQKSPISPRENTKNKNKNKNHNHNHNHNYTQKNTKIPNPRKLKTQIS
jgi:hypothetical protein